MYALINLLVLGGGIALLIHGIKRRRWVETTFGGIVLVLGLGFVGLLDFWAEMLWFESLGFSRRFWTVVTARVGFMLAGAAIGFLLLFLLTLPIPGSNRFSRLWPEAAGAFFGAVYGFSGWSIILKFVNRVEVGVADPILGKDAGFYLFTLPFLDLVQQWLFLLCCIAVAGAAAGIFLRVSQRGGDLFEFQIPWRGGSMQKSFQPLGIALGAALAMYAVGQYLNRYHLMYSRRGVVAGPGWTDVHILLPAYMVVAIVALVCAVIMVAPPLRRAAARLIGMRGDGLVNRVAGLGLPIAIVTVVWVIGIGIIPGLWQWLYVEPNEITVERPYIAHNINFTRQAYGLNQIKAREFPVSKELTKEKVKKNEDVLDDVRLWDWRALAQVYEQFQEIRLYYEFADVDVDRYRLGADYRQVMVSAREMQQQNLPDQSKTFVNLRFMYTHGYGLTMAPVSKFTPEGLPELLIKDIPPQAEFEKLQVQRPELYYGELTDSHVVVNTEEKEFDYPSGEQNVYARYDGSGGVQLSNLWRKFVYGAKFDGTRFFLSSYPTSESRVQFRRTIRERVHSVAPFLVLEDDPYVVINEGRIYWILDAYTSSHLYPYSEPYYGWEEPARRRQGVTRPYHGQQAAGHFAGRNYIRNSVKAVVNAYNGDVTLYVFEPEDPLIKVWQRIFPDLFTAAAQMPAGLRNHIRYPASFLLAQGLVYAKYHMTDPAVFYNQEDLWVRATEKYYNNVKNVDPYYVMWRPPESEETEFVLFLPFTPKNKQVLIGWIAGMCDGESYGDVLAYKFPKEKRVLGTQQVETKIDQDSYLSGQLSLWDQRGSQVIRGNMLVIPIQDTLLYVEPIYLKAETAAYPELRLVALMHNDNLSYAETFDAALQGLFTGEKPALGRGPGSEPKRPSETREGGEQLLSDLAREANTAFENYLQLQSERKFREASEQMKRLQQILEEMAARSGGDSGDGE